MASRSDALVALLAAGLAAQSTPAVDPFGFFQPTVAVGAADRRALEGGAAIVRVVPAKSPDVAIFSATKIAVGGDRLVEWVRRISELKRGPYVTAIARFSDPPQPDDVRALTLDDDDLAALRRCRPGSCGMKLGEAEMTRVRQAIAAGGAQWKSAAQQAFRQIVLDRARAYLAGGLAALPSYHDQDHPVPLDGEFALLLQESGYLGRHAPQVVEYLRAFPAARHPPGDSFLYWSKETLGGKPIVSVTHVTIVRFADAPLPEALAVARQIYASHYVTGSLALTAITRGPDQRRFLVYFNRSRVDVLDGFLGGIVRRVMERRLRGEAVQVVQELRRRLESGTPPEPNVQSDRPKG
jgi:hypothetical protein